MTSQRKESPGAESLPAGDPAGAVADFCREVIDLMGLDLQISALSEGANIAVNLTGADRPVLLSGTAAVLNSLEYLVNKIFRTGQKERIASIVLDSDHYRQHREAELVLLAQMASKKVLAQRRPLSLQPMTPKERRIIHLALAKTEGIRTESAGEGERRSITIFPA